MSEPGVSAPRIFLGLGDTCGVYSRLEDGMRQLGVPCEFVDAFPMRDYPRGHRPGAVGRVVEFLGRRRWRSRPGSLQRLVWMVAQGASLAVLGVWSALRFDVFVFAGGVSFLHGWDLPLLRFLGKRVIVVYHGSDCRPPYINGAYVGADVELDVAACRKLTESIYRWVRWIDSHADVVVSHPYFSHFSRRPIVSWMHVGIPHECPPAVSQPAVAGTEVVIVHAPTRPVPKGSFEIEAAVNRLRDRGFAIRLVKMVGRTPDEVMAELAKCDFVVDELYGDTPMAGFATEAAALGKPAIVGMHDVKSLAETMGAQQFPPTSVCDPADIEAAIERMVVDSVYRQQLGSSARQYVEGSCSPKAVAARFRLLAGKQIPPEWFFDPATLRYTHGWGLTSRRLREVVSAVVAADGIAALKLSDKPELEAVFQELSVPVAAESRPLTQPT